MTKLRTRSLATGIAMLAAACAGNIAERPLASDPKVWPEPPRVARIEFIGEFSDLDDLGVRRSLWGRAIRLVAGRESDDLVRPMAVVSSDDHKLIYVADPDAGCVHRYDLSRGRYSCLRLENGSELRSPVGLAIADDGTVFVSDSQRGKIYYLQVGGKWLVEFELDDQLEQPTGVFWHEEERLLYVTDTGRQVVKVFDRNGGRVRELGGRGTDEGQLNYPTYLWVDPRGHLLVTDSLNFRVQRYDENGGFLRTFGVAGDLEGDFARPKGVATDSYGHVYIVDALFHAVQIFDAHGALLLSVGGQGHDAGQFWLPNGIFISKDDRIYIADVHNRRVQMFRYVGPGS